MRAFVALWIAPLLLGCVATREDLRGIRTEQARVREELEAMQELLVELTIRLQSAEVGLDRQGRVLTDLQTELGAVTGRVRALGAHIVFGGPVSATAPDGSRWGSSAAAFAEAVSREAAGQVTAAAELFAWTADRWPNSVTGQVARVRQAELTLRAGDPLAVVDGMLLLLEVARAPEVVGPAYLLLARALHALGEDTAARRTLADLARLQPGREAGDEAAALLEAWRELRPVSASTEAAPVLD